MSKPSLFSPKVVIGGMIAFGFLGFVVGCVVATVGMIWRQDTAVLVGQTIMAVFGVPFASAIAFSALFMSGLDDDEPDPPQPYQKR